MRKKTKKKSQTSKKPTPFSSSFFMYRLFYVIPLVGFLLFFSWLPKNNNSAQNEENTIEYNSLIKEEISKIKEKNNNVLGTESGQIRVPILLYHYVGDNPNKNDKARDYLSVTPQQFDEQLSFLSQNGYQTISLDTLAAALLGGGSLPGKPIILTFDDGYIDFFLNAFPILSKYNFSATVFLPTGKIGQDMFLNWGQIEEMARSGRVIFNSHGINHVNMASMGGQVLDDEVSKSKQEITSHTGYPVNFLAYPYGTFSGGVIASLQKAGYVGALTTRTGSIVTKDGLYTLPRIKISGNISLSDFASRLNW